jgi:hypothetical protein
LKEKNELHNFFEITMFIHTTHPELSKFIEEFPVTIPNQKNPKITIENLETYYNSLANLISKYNQNH